MGIVHVGTVEIGLKWFSRSHIDRAMTSWQPRKMRWGHALLQFCSWAGFNFLTSNTTRHQQMNIAEKAACVSQGLAQQQLSSNFPATTQQLPSTTIASAPPCLNAQGAISYNKHSASQPPSTPARQVQREGLSYAVDTRPTRYSPIFESSPAERASQFRKKIKVTYSTIIRVVLEHQ